MATTSGVTRQDLDDLRDELKADIARVDGKVDILEGKVDALAAQVTELREELRQDRAENRAQYTEIIGYLKPD